MARQARGELAAARGDLDHALAYYSEAQVAYVAAGNEYQAARCLEATALVRQKRRDEGDLDLAQTAQSEARLIYERLGTIRSYGSQTSELSKSSEV